MALFTQIEKFEAILRMLDEGDNPEEIQKHFFDQVQLARRIIELAGLGTPAESIRLPLVQQIELALEIERGKNG